MSPPSSQCRPAANSRVYRHCATHHRDWWECAAVKDAELKTLDYWIDLVKRISPNKPWEREAFAERAQGS